MKKVHMKLFAASSALLILLWDYLMYCHLAYLGRFALLYAKNIVHHGQPPQWIYIIFNLSYCFFYMMFPLLGLLADVKIGRYNAITFGIIICFISWIIAGIGCIINEVLHLSPLLLAASFVIGFLLEAIGYTCFKANIVQYNIDQLVEASSSQLSKLICLHAACPPIVLFLYKLNGCLISNSSILITSSFILSGAAVSVVLVTHSLFKSHLQNISLIDNPVKLIVKVLNYARKHKYPENRSALTYWEEESPSRLDLGKRKYGGPFSEEEVENVKTVLRLLPLIVCVLFGLNFADSWKLSCCKKIISFPIMECLISASIFKETTSAVLIILFVILSYYTYKWILNMLSRIGIGLVFAFLVLITFILIVVFNVNMYDNLLILPQVLFGIANFLIFPTMLEFTIAQTPIEMRGVMVGLWYMTFGTSFSFSVNLSYFFHFRDEYICYNRYYYISKCCVVLTLLLVFLFLAKRYQYRVRDNEVNIHQIVDDHYQRYMDQAELHNDHT